LALIKIACSTATWGEEQKNILPDIIRHIRDAGYHGVEINWRFLLDQDPADLKKLLAENDLVLASVQVEGNLIDPTSQSPDGRDQLTRILDFLNAAGCSLLIYTGLRRESDSQFIHDIDILLKIIERSAGRQVQVLYRTRDTEFKDNYSLFSEIYKMPTIRFCPDPAWIARGRDDVLNLLNRMSTRIGGFVYRDYRSYHAETAPVPLGSGIAMLDDVSRWIKGRFNIPLWIIAEQEQSKIPPDEAILLNGLYLRRTFKIVDQRPVGLK
jgi:sugar phosphate isomerase/epimerase